MADRKKSKETPMSFRAFRAKKAGAGSSTSTQKTTSNEGTKSSTTKTTTSAEQESRSRPQTASKSKAPRSRSASVDSLNSSSISIEARQEKVKQLRNKQVEDKKKKNEERRLAFEERKKKRDEEEKRKWEALKQQAAMHRPGSGRKLPTPPDAPKRPATAGPTRPTALPKSLKTTSASKLPGQGTVKSPTKSPAQSSSSHSSDSSPRQSPTTHGKSLLSAKRPGSSTNILNENRRASTSNLARPSTASKNRPSSIHGADSKLSTSRSHNSLSTSTHTVKKAQSTSALHRIGTDRPHHPKKHVDKHEKPKAGMLDEAAAKQALAERRKQAREEAERKAKLDLERQEEERKKKEEEEKKLAEEMAKEEERMRELAELLKQQNEEKMKKAAEEKEKRDKEEAERLAAEERQREEERKMKEEEERIAKIEAEKKAKEDEERRKKEEIERQERRRRVEEIMSRTRQAKTDSPNPESTETVSTPPQETTKTIDVEDIDTKRKISEILQKVKDRTESVSPVSSVDSEPSTTTNTVQNVQEGQDTAHESENTLGDQSEDSVREEISDEMENPKPIQEVTGVASGNDSVIKVRVRISETRTEVKVNGREVQRTLSHEHVSKNEQMNGNTVNTDDDQVPDAEESNDNQDGNTSFDPNGSMNGHEKREYADVRQDKENKEQLNNSSRDPQISANMEDLWKNTELLMQNTENSTSEKLENAGIVAEGDNDEQSEEGRLWKVVEGSGVALSDVVA